MSSDLRPLMKCSEHANTGVVSARREVFFRILFNQTRLRWINPPKCNLILWISSSFSNAWTTRITQSKSCLFSHINLQIEQYSIEKQCCPVYPPKRKALWDVWKGRIHIIITDWKYSFGFDWLKPLTNFQYLSPLTKFGRLLFSWLCYD